jgi:hypothetical protein
VIAGIIHNKVDNPVTSGNIVLRLESIRYLRGFAILFCKSSSGEYVRINSIFKIRESKYPNFAFNKDL